jgi:hypothetical protein
MGDPVARIRKFVDVQRQQACFEEAKTIWALKIMELRPALDAVVDALSQGLVPGQFVAEPVAVLTDGSRDQFPLMITFAPRAAIADGVVPLRTEPLPVEVGASAMFRCEPDGHVHGYRYPFHLLGQALDPEQYIDLGFPAHIGPDELGNAVADFMEWAAVGGGCANRELQFWSPATLPFPKPPPAWDLRAA